MKAILYPVPIVSAIIERERDGEIEVLVQTRWKPDQDPLYSGTLEIPAGTIGKHENVYDALRREVLEETGLEVISFRPNVQTRTHAQRGDEVFAFLPFKIIFRCSSFKKSTSAKTSASGKIFMSDSTTRSEPA